MTCRSLVAFILSCAALSACKLEVSGLAGDGQRRDGPSEGGDTPGGVMAGDGDAGTESTDGSPALAPLCDETRRELVGCYNFDGDLLDGSSNSNDATAMTVSFVGGMHGEALKIDAASAIQIPDAPSWEFAAATVEMWINPAEIPQGNYGDASPRAGLLDKEGQFGLFIHPGGQLSCSLGATVVGGMVAKDVWTHVACTADSAQVALYVDGGLIESQPGAALSHSGAVVAVGANSPSGDPFNGVIDDLRVWSVARTQAEICEAAAPNCVKR